MTTTVYCYSSDKDWAKKLSQFINKINDQDCFFSDTHDEKNNKFVVIKQFFKWKH